MRKSKRRLLGIMHSYKRLKETDQLSEVRNIRNRIANTKLIFQRKSSDFWVSNFEDRELSARQYLMVRFVDLEFNSEIIYALNSRQYKAVITLPREWREVVRDEGIQIDNFRSAISWNVQVLYLWLQGVFFIAKYVLWGIKETRFKRFSQLGKYVYFDSLSSKNLPKESGNYEFGILSWFVNWSGNSKKTDTICHSVPGVTVDEVNEVSVSYLNSPFPPVTGIKNICNFLSWGIASSFLAIVELISGNWMNCCLFKEIVLKKVVSMNKSGSLAENYLFNNSQWIYRPIWTYEAEKKGSSVTFYFYSTNIENFKRPQQYPVHTNQWELTSWSNYLVWNDYQVDFLKRYVKNNYTSEVVGSISFQFSLKRVSSLPPNSIAVFDVQPMRDSYYQKLGIAFEYYSPSTSESFLKDICQEVMRVGANMIFKRKRDLGKIIHHKYRRLLDQINIKDHFISMDPEIPAECLIRDSIAVISMPFTSTAILALEMGKPTAYYDPGGLILKDDPASHGIKLLTGVEELREWICSISIKC